MNATSQSGLCRSFFHSGVGLIAILVFASALALLAEDFWKEKPPPEWTEEETVEFLNDSPWARTEDLWQLTGRRLAVFADGSTAVYQETPTSPPIQYSPAPVRIDPERWRAVYAVRWSSAPIVTEALARLRELNSVLAEMQAPPEEVSPDHYVLTVRVVQPPAPSASDKLSRAQVFNEQQQPVTDVPHEGHGLFFGLDEEEMMQAAELRTSRKLRLHPDRVVRHGLGTGAGVSFYFPRRTGDRQTLPSNTDWVEFRFKDRKGNELKARFKLEEMESTQGLATRESGRVN